MKRGKLAIMFALATLSLGVAGCGNHDSDSPPPDDMEPPPPEPVAFSAFVKTQFANTANDTDPEAVDDADFSFDDQDNAEAFDDLLSSTP